MINNPPKILPLIMIVSLLGAIGTGYFYFQYKGAQKKLLDPAQAVKAETQTLVESVGKHMLLPADEQPTIATISDKEKLSGQPFFVNAKNGDKVLIYNAAKKAILYDPIADKILEVAPVNLGSPSAESNTTPAPTSQASASILSSMQPTIAATPLRVGIYNGTNASGMTTKVENQLKEAGMSIEAVVKDNTIKKEYASTTIFDVSNTKKTDAARIASIIKGAIGGLPADETSLAYPTGKVLDLVIIVGTDYSNAVNGASTSSVSVTPAPTSVSAGSNPAIFP